MIVAARKPVTEILKTTPDRQEPASIHICRDMLSKQISLVLGSEKFVNQQVRSSESARQRQSANLRNDIRELQTASYATDLPPDWMYLPGAGKFREKHKHKAEQRKDEIKDNIAELEKKRDGLWSDHWQYSRQLEHSQYIRIHNLFKQVMPEAAQVVKNDIEGSIDKVDFCRAVVIQVINDRTKIGEIPRELISSEFCSLVIDQLPEIMAGCENGLQIGQKLVTVLPEEFANIVRTLGMTSEFYPERAYHDFCKWAAEEILLNEFDDSSLLKGVKSNQAKKELEFNLKGLNRDFGIGNIYAKKEKYPPMDGIGIAAEDRDWKTETFIPDLTKNAILWPAFRELLLEKGFVSEKQILNIEAKIHERLYKEVLTGQMSGLSEGRGQAALSAMFYYSPEDALKTYFEVLHKDRISPHVKTAAGALIRRIGLSLNDQRFEASLRGLSEDQQDFLGLIRDRQSFLNQNHLYGDIISLYAQNPALVSFVKSVFESFSRSEKQAVKSELRNFIESPHLGIKSNIDLLKNPSIDLPGIMVSSRIVPHPEACADFYYTFSASSENLARVAALIAGEPDLYEALNMKFEQHKLSSKRKAEVLYSLLSVNSQDKEMASQAIKAFAKTGRSSLGSDLSGNLFQMNGYSAEELKLIQSSIAGQLSLLREEVQSQWQDIADKYPEAQSSISLLPIYFQSEEVYAKAYWDSRVEKFDVFAFFPQVIAAGHDGLECQALGRNRLAVRFEKDGEIFFIKSIQTENERKIAELADRIGIGPEQLPTLDGFVTEKSVSGSFFNQLPDQLRNKQAMRKIGENIGIALKKLHDSEIAFNDCMLLDDYGHSHLAIDLDYEVKFIDFGNSLMLSEVENPSEEFRRNYAKSRFGSEIPEGATKSYFIDSDCELLKEGLYYASMNGFSKDLLSELAAGFEESSGYQL